METEDSRCARNSRRRRISSLGGCSSGFFPCLMLTKTASKLCTSLKMSRPLKSGGPHSGRSQRNLVCHTLITATATRLRSKADRGSLPLPSVALYPYIYTVNSKCTLGYAFNNIFIVHDPCIPLIIPSSAIVLTDSTRSCVAGWKFFRQNLWKL